MSGQKKRVAVQSPFFSCRAAGFTLIELVVTMIVVTVLAIAVAPRFSGTQGFNQRGFFDETLALLRYAQKSAIAQRRTVCVTFTASSASLSIASVADSISCDTPLTGPTGTAPFVVTGASGAQYVMTPANFSFDAEGRPSFASSVTIQVTGLTQGITVEAGTGYVH